MNDLELWERRIVEINTILSALVAEEPALKSLYSGSPLWKHHQLLIEASMSYSSIMLIYIAGFEAIFNGTPDLHVAVPVRHWVKRVKRDRSALAIASMNVSAHCSSLEGFLRSMAENVVDQAVIDRMRLSYRRPTRSGQPECLSIRLPAARRQLDAWLKPSGGAAFTEWIKVVSHLFGCSLPAEVRSSLEDMIAFRHTITHLDALPDDDTLASPGAARSTCWGLAVMAAGMIITHTAVRLVLPASTR